jgi:hypothetical protein
VITSFSERAESADGRLRTSAIPNDWLACRIEILNC